MNITNAIWADAAQTTIKITSVDGADRWVPNTQHDRDRFGITAWGAEGNTIGEFVAPPIQPPTLSSRQIRLALISTGTTLSEVQALIDGIQDQEDRATAQIEWDHATSFEFDHPLIPTFSSALGYTEAQMDTLWTWAATL